MEITSLITQYRKSLKNPYAEEVIDLVLYRPIAFLFVKITEFLPLTPNFVSLLAMVAGIAAGAALSRGTPRSFMAGGLIFALSNILDCSDGMIARLKKNGAKTGRIVDGLVDYIASSAVYLGFGIGLAKAMQSGAIHLPCNPWLLIAAAVVSTILHSIVSDNYRNAFLRRQSASMGTEEDERTIFANELTRLKALKGHMFDKVLIKIYLRYLDIQKGKSGDQSRPLSPALPASTPVVSRWTVILWNLIGPSTHITAIILAAMLFQPWILFIFVIGLANLWMIGLFLTQQGLKRI